MIARATQLGEIGWFGDDLWDVATSVYDRVEDVATSIADAGKQIGAVLKFVSPIVAFYPGLGTALSVALYAAGAAAAADDLGDAALGVAASAMPVGLPRIGFDSGVAITKQLVRGENIFTACVDAGRSAAAQADPSGRALKAFDTGLAIARGGKVSDEVLKMARANIAPMGALPLAAFDASVTLAQGKGAGAAGLAAARDFIAASGGPVAVAAFDGGVALAYGEDLQAVGFAALQGYVEGNDAAERAVKFIEKMIRAAENGTPLWAVLVDDLYLEIQRVVGAKGALAYLTPLLESLHLDPSQLGIPPELLAAAWGVAEPLARAAIQIVKEPTPKLLEELTRPRVASIGKVHVDPATAAKEDARWAAVLAANPTAIPICLRAQDARARNSPVAADLEAQCRAQSAARGPSAPSAVSLASSGARLLTSAPTFVPKPPPPLFIPPAAIVASAPAPEEGASASVVAGSVAGVAAVAVALYFWARA